MATKKKITQDELRRLMSEQKKKFTVGSKRIESPLAKYDQSGQLTCIVCDSIVRSESVWTVHLNSKNHRENITKRAKRKESPVSLVPEPPKRVAIVPPEKHPPPSAQEPAKLKSILKNSTGVFKVPQVPKDFFESSSRTETAPTEPSKDEEESEKEEKVEEEEELNSDQLPEGFFDDPKLDAKVRNVEYKDPIEEEWDQFQKAIKEETSKAQIIISEDQDEATNERQIDEIDEQLRHWSRVVSLEKKKQEAVPAVVQIKAEADDDAAEDESFDEFVDWRSKKSFL